MFVEMNPSNGGGGSAKSGTTNATAAGGTLTIDTGLSEVNQFVWFATQAANNKQCIVTYDKDMGNYYTAAVPAVNQGNFKRAIGSTPQSQVPVITSISGGTVVVSMATGSCYGNCNAGYWFAQ